jgi:arginase
VAPTLNVEELDKRIEELKAVHFWLDQNAKALAATVQALEVQKMTLATLQGMNFNMGDVANALKLKAADTVLGGVQKVTETAAGAAGTVSGVARRAAKRGRPLFVLWLDAHPDFHTLDTTTSGNLHGVPLAYASGQQGFEGYFPDPAAAVPPQRICVLGVRSVDPAERSALNLAGVTVHDMRAIDEHGIARLLRDFLERVAREGGMLHVSLDVDFLDPSIAPAVGTTVPGGATMREAHLVMEMLHDSGLVTSLDLVELNPFLDERGRTATLMVDLTASLMGRRVMDRPTQSY